MIFLAWLIGIAIGFSAVFSGIYTTEFAKDVHWDNPDRCEFEVRVKMCTLFELFKSFHCSQPNHVYSIVSGVVTFWLPAVVMVYVYIRYIVSQEIL